MARSGQVDFIGIYDVDQGVATQTAREHGVRVFTSLEAAMEAAEAFSVVTPTATHHSIARALLERHRHVLVEKPMTSDANEASELIALAAANVCVLQVGHVERFNPVFHYLNEAAKQPKFIEAHRLSPYPARSTDIGVVLDLMIHDLDIVMAFVNSPVAEFDAVGIPVLSRNEDIANVRLKFANGCIANVTASRVSAERLRKIRVFSEGNPPSYISLDYFRQEGYIFRLADPDTPESSLLKKLIGARTSTIISEFAGRKIVREPVPIQRSEPLKLELESFINCVQDRQSPVVSGEAGKQALDLALEITRRIARQ